MQLLWPSFGTVMPNMGSCNPKRERSDLAMHRLDFESHTVFFQSTIKPPTRRSSAARASLNEIRRSSVAYETSRMKVS